jgi:hypothetical protein
MFSKEFTLPKSVGWSAKDIFHNAKAAQNEPRTMIIQARITRSRVTGYLAAIYSFRFPIVILLNLQKYL